MAIDEKKRLVRSEHNKVIAGVAGGIGAHFNVDPILVRIAFVLLALVDGIGVVAYLAAWALIPKEGELRSPAESAMAKVNSDAKSRNNSWIWIAILAIAGILVLASIDGWSWGGGLMMWDGGLVIWALVLIGAGIWLYRQDVEGRGPGAGPSGGPGGAPITEGGASGGTTANLPAVRSETTPVADTPDLPAGPVSETDNPTPGGTVAATETSTGSGATVTQPVGVTGKPPASRAEDARSDSGAAPLTGPPVATAAETTRVMPAVPVARRRKSHLGRYTLAVALLVVGIAALLENAGNIELSGIQYGGLILATIGAGLLVGTFWGRSRLMILAGLVLLPLIFATDLLGGWFGVPLQAGAGDRFFAPSSAAEVRDSYELTAGVLNLDLTGMRWGADPVEVEATVGFGEVNVLVPEGVAVEVLGRATVGAVSLFGDERAGFGVRLDVAEIRRRDQPYLVLDLRTVTGQVEVARSSDQVRGR